MTLPSTSTTTRRTALGLLGGAAVAALTGCVGTLGGGNGASLEAEDEEFVVDPDDDTVESDTFTLHNRGSSSLSVNAGAWRVERRAGDDWVDVARGDGDGEDLTLPAGGSHEWSLSLTSHPTPRTDDTTFVTVAMDEGRHAFVVEGEGDERWRAEFDLVKREGTARTA